MACFGFGIEDPTENLMDKDLVNSLKKKSPWNISWPRFRPNKSAAKTVPVNISFSGDLAPVLPLKPHHKNASSKLVAQSIGVNATNKSHKKKLEAVEKIDVGEKNHSSSLARDEKKLPTRKKETNKTGSSKPGSPPKPPHKYSRPAITSPPHRDKILPKPATGDQGNDNIDVNKKGVDSVAGMSVIILILVIMLFWGKLCAILCTCAWFYMIPLVKPAVDSHIVLRNGPENISGEPDLDSGEYKKKVVLEGLLRRNRRTTIGIL